MYGLILRDETPSIYFVTPALIGFFLRHFLRPRWQAHLHRRELARIGESFAREARYERLYGSIVKPPGLHDRLLRIVHLGVGSLPFLIALFVVPSNWQSSMAI